MIYTEVTQMMEAQKSAKISIMLYLPSRVILKVGVNKYAKVSILKNAIKSPDNSNYMFTYQGMLLSESSNIADYNIPSQSIIIVQKRMQETKRIQPELNLSEAEYITDSYRGIHNDNTKREMYRLNDLQMVKYERNPRAFRKLVACYDQQEQELKYVPNRTYYDIPAQYPVDIPLPVFWDVSYKNSSHKLNSNGA